MVESWKQASPLTFAALLLMQWDQHPQAPATGMLCLNMDAKRSLQHADLAQDFVTTMMQVGKPPLEIPSHLIVSGTRTFLSLI